MVCSFKICIIVMLCKFCVMTALVTFTSQYYSHSSVSRKDKEARGVPKGHKQEV